MKLTSICFVIFLIFFLNASALQQFINGSVTDEETCLPMAGVNVIIDSAILGTTTESKAEARLTIACNYQDIRTSGHQDTRTPRHQDTRTYGKFSTGI